MRSLKLASFFLMTVVMSWQHDANAHDITSPEQAEQAPILIDDFVRDDNLSELHISPTGKYLALIVQHGNRDDIVVLHTSDLSTASINNLPQDQRVESLHWSSPEKIVFLVSQTYGRYSERSVLDWASINADGSGLARLWSLPVLADGHERSSSSLIESLLSIPGNDDGKMLTTTSMVRKGMQHLFITEVDTNLSKQTVLARLPNFECAPAMNGRAPVIALCPAAEIKRLPDGSSERDIEVLRYQSDGSWKLIRTLGAGSNGIEIGGWSDDGDFYVYRSDAMSTVSLGKIDPDTGEFEKIFHDSEADPVWIITTNDKRGTIIGAVTEKSLPRVTLIDEAHPDAGIYTALASSFPGKLVLPGSATRDGKKFVFEVLSDASPTEVYLFDRDTNRARLLMRHRDWLDPARMATVKPFESTTRDGTKVYGYLTMPRGGSGKHLPMIVAVHGGPVGSRDSWEFDVESQLLASRGYLVLRVNFRGSSGYGQPFENMAYGQWGTGIMHDIIDATKWAINEGYADKDRICIYGSSFGGYAAMMAPTIEQSLYRCAFGYIGMYDAEIQMKRSDTGKFRDGREYLERSLGKTREARAAISPVNRAHLIGIPVYLAAGKDDERCPPEHTIAMQKALTAAGSPPEGVIIQKGEKHGFEKPENNLKLYTEMLAFFDRHIGRAAKPAAAPATP